MWCHSLGQNLKEIQSHNEHNSWKQCLSTMVFKNYQFTSVQSLSRSRLFATAWIATKSRTLMSNWTELNTTEWGPPGVALITSKMKEQLQWRISKWWKENQTFNPWKTFASPALSRRELQPFEFKDIYPLFFFFFWVHLGIITWKTKDYKDSLQLRNWIAIPRGLRIYFSFGYCDLKISIFLLCTNPSFPHFHLQSFIL